MTSPDHDQVTDLIGEPYVLITRYPGKAGEVRPRIVTHGMPWEEVRILVKEAFVTLVTAPHPIGPGGPQ